MKQTYGIMGIVGVFLLLIGAAGADTYSNTNAGLGMMDNNQRTYQGMMNSNTNYRGIMGNLDQNTINKMNALHDEMTKNLDPETAKQMEAMHDACMGDDDSDEQ